MSYHPDMPEPPVEPPPEPLPWWAEGACDGCGELAPVLERVGSHDLCGACIVRELAAGVSVPVSEEDDELPPDTFGDDDLAF